MPSEPSSARHAPVAAARVVEELHVVWPDRARIDAAVVARTTEATRAAIERSTVPVLLPRAGRLAERAVAIAKPAFSAISIDADGEDAGLSIAISATKIAHRHRGIDPVRATSSVRGGKPAWVLQNEGIWSVSWEENGVSYVVDLECARPSEDARCASADRVLAIVEDLVFAGGSFGGSK